jgi:hydrogenase nickel incorporation protein HypA/HybF
MHETALMQNLLSTVSQAAREHSVKRVNSVTVVIGKLSNVMPDALAFAFEAMTQEGLMKGAALEMVFQPAVAQCGACRHEYEADGFPIVCPVCANRDFRLISGEEVYIQSMDCEE